MFRSFLSPVVWLFLFIVWLAILFAGGIPIALSITYCAPSFAKAHESYAGWLVLAEALASLVASIYVTRSALRWANRPPGPWPDPPTSNDPRRDAESDLRIAVRIRLAARVGATIGFLGGAVAAVALFIYPRGVVRHSSVRGVLMLPLTMGGAGFFFGLAMACFFAPASFLEGPIGRPYMEKIGTRSVTVARAACLAMGLVIVVPLLLLGLIFLGAALG